MEIRDEIATVKWIEKVINSCETEPQRKSAGRLAKNWVKSNRPLKYPLKYADRGWDNFMALGNHLVRVMKAKKKELALAKDTKF